MLAFSIPAYQTVTRKKMFRDEDILVTDREFGHMRTLFGDEDTYRVTKAVLGAGRAKIENPASQFYPG